MGVCIEHLTVLIRTKRQVYLWHGMVLEMHVQVFLSDKLFSTVLLPTDKIFYCLTVAEHVFLNRLLRLVLGTTKVTYMELRFLGPCHDF